MDQVNRNGGTSPLCPNELHSKLSIYQLHAAAGDGAQRKGFINVHQKQLSADSTSPRMKYNFNSCPNLRPKSVSVSRSSPGTPNLSASGHRQRPPPPPPIAVTASIRKDFDDDDDDGGIEVKTFKSVTNSPVLFSTRWTSNFDYPPVPKPRRQKHTNQSLKLTQPSQVKSSTDSDTKGPDLLQPVAKPRRRVPPLPPTVRNLSSKDEADGHTTTIAGMHGVTSTKVQENKKDVVPALSQPLSIEEVQRLSISTNHEESASDTSTSHRSVRPPGLLFTPPPSRSHSLKKFANSKYTTKFSSFEISDVKSSSRTPALSKPLPPLPSLSKPLPPLPTSNLSPLPITDSDYAYISDSPERHSSPSFNVPDQSKLHHNSSPHDQFEEYVHMSTNDLSQCSEEDGYLPMSAITQDGVFGEDSAGYIAMFPGQPMVDETPKIASEGIRIEDETDEYVKMSSSSIDDDNTDYSDVSRSCNQPSSTLQPSTMSKTKENLFDYNSMYIDLDMIKPVVAQHDNEAKHPKSRFSISSSEPSPLPAEQTRYGRSLEPSPRHSAQTISKLPPVPDTSELDVGIYTTIPDFIYSKMYNH